MSNNGTATVLDANALQQGEADPTRKCPLESTLAYYYQDSWNTNIHQFGFEPYRAAGTGGFVTGKPEYLVGGKGRTEAARAAGGANENNYDARIYSHFNMNSIQIAVGTPPSKKDRKKGQKKDQKGHQRGDHSKRRFLARALELEVYLYLDSLRFWTLDTFAFSRGAGPTESSNSSSPSRKDVENWVSDKREYWSNLVTRRKKTDPPLTGSSQTPNDWWNKRENLHQVFASLAEGDIIEIETELEDHATCVSELLGVKLPGLDTSNRFWAEGLCETVRETSLVSTVFPQLMEALVCNIPAALWSWASPKTGDILLRIMARAAASLVYKLNRELHIASKAEEEVAFNAFLASFGLPAKEPVPEHLQHIPELVARIENINDLVALHAAALHHCFTAEQTVFIKPGRHVTLRPRAVDGARPTKPTQVLCFKTPMDWSKRRRPGSKATGPCPPQDCVNCFTKKCTHVPCESTKCHATATENREFVRQLREQQAVLNGTPRALLQTNRNLVQKAPAGTGLVRDRNANPRAARRWFASRIEQLMQERNISRSEAKAVALKERSSEIARLERAVREADIERRFNDLRKNKQHSTTSDGALRKQARREFYDEYERTLAEEIATQRTQYSGMKEEEIESRAKAAIREKAIGRLLTSRYQGLAVLHALDIIAGGHALQLLGMGDGRANSIIGEQWISTPGKKLAEALANEPAHKGEVYPNVELVVCPPECDLKRASSSAHGTSQGTTP